MANIQVVEFSTRTLTGLGEIVLASHPIDILREIAIPSLAALFGTVAGATIAFWTEKRARKREERKRIVGRLLLVREDMRFCQNCMAADLARSQNPRLGEQFMYCGLPATHFNGLDYVQLSELVRVDGVLVIREAISLVGHWNDWHLRGMKVDANEFSSFGQQCFDWLENAIKLIEKAVPEIGNTETPFAAKKSVSGLT